MAVMHRSTKLNFVVVTAVLLLAAYILWQLLQRESDAGRRPSNEVIVYVSEDRVFAQPVLLDFERRTGIDVKEVYEAEQTGPTGLAGRLLAEKDQPRADVFWSREPVCSIALQRDGVFEPYPAPNAILIPSMFKDPQGYWIGFAARSRVIVYNTRLVKREEAPASMFDLTDPKWKAQVAMADPRSGSASFHAAALFLVLGDKRAEQYFRDLKANGVKIVSGDSAVRRMVSRGEAKVGWADSDDVSVARKAGEPLEMVYPDQQGIGVPVMPNTLSLIRGGPNAENGKRLINDLLVHAEAKLADSEAAQMPLNEAVTVPPGVRDLNSLKPMALDYAAAAARLDDVVRKLQDIFKL